MKVNQPNNYRVECSTLFFYSCFGTGSPDKLLFTKIAIICIRRQTHAFFSNNWGGRHLISNSLEILSKSDYSLEYISPLHPPPFQKKVIFQQSPWYSTTSFCGVKVSILQSKLFTKNDRVIQQLTKCILEYFCLNSQTAVYKMTPEK